ncbi:hypothetical protein [Sphingobacterium chungjuense]|uniref:hypothetical protein n=1 Tax=Sphingobacterium chungjuense TaxID=2675553 RepID=UPI0014095E62|nr:hypothetical protein [Sphingobacterium chungjuense]
MASQSQARQQSLDFLDNLGSDKSNFRDPSAGLESVAGDFVKRVIENINQADTVDSGRIQDLNIVVVSPIQLQITGQKYINFIDQGVQGAVNNTRAPLSPYKYTTKMPDPAIFEEWIKSKNIKVRNTKYYTGQGSDTKIDVGDDDKQIKQAAYAMALNRYKNGAKPVPIFSKEIPKLVADAAQIVGQITVTDILSNLDI